MARARVLCNFVVTFACLRFWTEVSPVPTPLRPCAAAARYRFFINSVRRGGRGDASCVLSFVQPALLFRRERAARSYSFTDSYGFGYGFYGFLRLRFWRRPATPRNVSLTTKYYGWACAASHPPRSPSALPTCPEASSPTPLTPPRPNPPPTRSGSTHGSSRHPARGGPIGVFGVSCHSSVRVHGDLACVRVRCSSPRAHHSSLLNPLFRNILRKPDTHRLSVP
jgi:hypothetical protein